METEKSRPLRRNMHRLEDNIKMGFKEIWLDVINWINVPRYRVQRLTRVNTVMKFRFHIKHGIS
jgi:hypothetical protein